MSKSSNRDWLKENVQEQLHSRKSVCWLVILSLITIVLARLPLFGILGFEFSFAIALIASLMGADLGSAFVKKARTHQCPPVMRAIQPWQAVWDCWKYAYLQGAFLLLSPILIILIASLWNQNCDWIFGIKSFLLLPLLSLGISTGVGVLSALIAGRKRVVSAILPYLLILSSLLISLWHFYQAPAVFSYNPFAGYFPGNLYDEHIALEMPLFWSRLFQFTTLAALASLVCLKLDVPTLTLQRSPVPLTSRKRTLFATIVFSLTAGILYWNSGSLRFKVSQSDVRQELLGRYETEHFIIHYPAVPELAQQIALIADDHEFRRAQLVRDLQVNFSGKIHSYYFKSPSQKHELMGAKNVYMAKPWRHEIYMNYSPFPHPVLKHELAHVLAGKFGDPIFEVSAKTLLSLPVFFNIGLIEGIAVAADWPDHFNKALTPHQSVKAMIELGMSPPLNQLFSTGFLSFSSSRSYTLAGSFLRFLWDQYGINKLKKLYKSGGNFKEAYQQSQSHLSLKWQEFIAKQALPDGAAEIVRERFRRPAIFSRPCPHAIANAQSQIETEVAVGNLSFAIGISKSICKLAPHEPRYQLQLARLLKKSGLYDQAKNIYSNIKDDTNSISSTLRAVAHFELVKSKVNSGEIQSGIEELQKIGNMPIGEDMKRTASVLERILAHKGPAGPPLRSIFWPSNPEVELDPVVLVGLALQAVRSEPELGLAYYLAGRQMLGRHAPDATRQIILQALEKGLPPLVKREAARMLAESSYKAGAYNDVIKAAKILTGSLQPRVTQLTGYDWMERVHWAKTGDVPPKALSTLPANSHPSLQ